MYAAAGLKRQSSSEQKLSLFESVDLPHHNKYGISSLYVN